MPQRVPLLPREELDAMIGRAEAACLRYRRAAEERGLSPSFGKTGGPSSR